MIILIIVVKELLIILVIKRAKHIVKLDNIFDDNIDIFLEFDKDSIIYSKYMKKINNFRILIFTILGVIYLLALVLLIRGNI